MRHTQTPTEQNATEKNVSLSVDIRMLPIENVCDACVYMGLVIIFVFRPRIYIYYSQRVAAAAAATGSVVFKQHWTM